MVVVGNSQRAIFDVQIQKYIASSNPENAYFHYQQQYILNKDVFFTPTMIEIPQVLKPFLSNRKNQY